MDSTPQSDLEIISFRQILLFFWRWKWVMTATTFVFMVCSLVWVVKLPNVYQANILVVSNDSESSGGLANLAGQLGGLASLAGVNLGAEKGGEASVALSILESRSFVMKFIDKYELLPALIAAEGWDPESDELIYDEDVFDPKSHRWNTDSFEGELPSSWKGYLPFMNRLEIVQESDSGVVDIYFEHYSPSVAVHIAQSLVKEINEQMRITAIKEAEKSVSYLNSEVLKTPVTELKSVFYRLIEEQTKTLMLAKVREDYIFRVVAEPVLPEDKNSPKRLFLVIVITFVGGIFSLFLSLFLEAVLTKQDH